MSFLVIEKRVFLVLQDVLLRVLRILFVSSFIKEQEDLHKNPGSDSRRRKSPYVATGIAWLAPDDYRCHAHAL